MRLQHQIYTVVQPSDFNMRSDAWNKRLTYYLAFNKTNYARYWTWYRHIGLRYRDIGRGRDTGLFQKLKKNKSSLPWF